MILATHACEIKNDPSLKSFGKEEKSFPFPCRYLATHVKTSMLSSSGNTVGSCEAWVYAFNSKAKGKLFVSGFDVGIVFNFNVGFAIEYSFRQFATADDNVNNVSIIDVDNVNNAKGCGLDIFFVPFDSALKLRQKQMPGLSVAVSELNSYVHNGPESDGVQHGRSSPVR
ncbi:hypothetical protein PoB_001480600 [Plakobranchus ocellatus]|uniref:Uncharacterized protein n=1 Tax=Plakobranchus ocellatus TaxID=259542 RepID=A0AAV3Z152_9GAST|nr:hypothetical protein PoB_001480600 [Plakobranchus ocellatus]